MKLNICVAIQVKSGNIEDTAEIIKKALDNGANFIELRFDYIDKIKRITLNFIKSLISLIHPTAQVIFTFRDYNEGGETYIEDKLRLELLKLMISSKPDYLDIEMATSNIILKEIIELAIKHHVSLIFSFHDFKKTPT